MGSIALGRIGAESIGAASVELLGEAQVAGGELSVSLVQAIANLLAAAGVEVGDLAGIAAVAGPGSFTGIRIGLAAVKALAEAAGLPVVAVSRLALLADLAHAKCAVLDAYRGQIYCGIYPDGEAAREMLLTAGDVNSMGGLPGPVAVCEEAVAQFVENLAGEPELVRVAAPNAAAALRFSVGRWLAGDFVDVALLDGYYLRGADAKISAKPV
jgi:tRNA threonylcarbamoyladenosine biosynthesis protein TsaB